MSPPTRRRWPTSSFAWRACRSVKSNAIVLVSDGATVGVGMGQVNRVDSAKLAVARAGEDRARGAVGASDAFFPFPDGLEVLTEAGVRAVVQPGGSMRDDRRSWRRRRRPASPCTSPASATSSTEALDPVPAQELAQLNVARLREPIDSPLLAPFVAALDAVNAVADRSPGFVWRLQDDAGNATALRPWGDDVIVNLSVWRSVEALRAYVYSADHAAVLRRRREWFVPYDGPHLVLWWVDAGHLPTVEEAGDRLGRLAADGPGPAAFTLRQPYPVPG